MSDESDSSKSSIPIKRKKNIRSFEDSSTSSNNNSPIGNTSKRRINRNRIYFNESDSDSGSSIDTKRRKRKLPRITSDESDSSGSVIRINRTRSAKRLPSESESSSEDSDGGFDDSSQWETDISDNETTNKNNATAKVSNSDIDSDSSNGQSDKCPICLISFKNQEIGVPESCDHAFCVECILEWSKNVNTCPVDRQEFSLIRVRKNISGKTVRQIPVQLIDHTPEYEIIDDTTICEICASSDREDRMLLCDGCDLGFHLECLDPPLSDVPTGSWFCNTCSPRQRLDEVLVPFAVQLFYDDLGDLLTSPNRHRNHSSTRLIPRTRQSERVRRRIVNNRNNQITQQGNNDVERTVTSTSRTTTTKKRKIKKRKKRRKTKIRYRTVYEIDELTGETVAVKKRMRKYKKRRKTKRKQRRQDRERIAKNKSVKKRLAVKLGISRPRHSVPQSVPDIRVPTQTSSSIGIRRQQAGIPALHLFGQRNDLDYFSMSEDETIDLNDGLLIHSRSNNYLRRNNRLKSISDIQLAPSATVTSSTDFLDTILNNQTKFHSKNTVFSIDKNGKFIMESNNNNRIQLHKINYENCIKKCPTTQSNNNDNSPSSSGSRSNNYQNNSTNNFDNNIISTSTSDNNNTVSNPGGNNSNDEPVDYQNSPNYSYDMNEDNKKDNKNKRNDDNNKSDSDSDIDIYSDIETVSTSKIDDGDFNKQQPSPLPSSNITPNTNGDTDDENNDSDTNMVIDTDKIDNEKLEQTTTDNEENVSSTVDTLNEQITSTQSTDLEIQSKTIQSTNQNDNNINSNRNNNDDDDDLDSEDGCPNFSIYSKESINLAKNTEIFLNDNLQPENNQISEISSSPAIYIERNDNNNANKESSTNNNEEEERNEDITSIDTNKKKISTGLYSDSEDETIVKKDTISFGLSDIRNMTEDISEEERSYTPCLDERVPIRQGLDGLETEMIVSDEDRNDFDESHDLKTVSDGDALEINAKESELDFTRPEDYEEGEIVDKLKNKKLDDANKTKDKNNENNKKSTKETEIQNHNNINKENNENVNTTNKDLPSFKKLSRNNKERNYRDRDKGRDRDSKSRERKDERDKKDRKREKRKEIERYDVRALIAEKPRRLKDKFGRDIRRSTSRSSGSLTPRDSPVRGGGRRSLSKNRRSPSIGKNPKSRRSLSRERINRNKRNRDWSATRKSISRSRSRSIERKRSRSKTNKRIRRSISRDRNGGAIRRRKSMDRSKNKSKKIERSRSRHRSRSPLTPKRRKPEWNRRYSREWTPSLSRSKSIEPIPTRHLSPSWTPPRRLDNAIKPHNLTVILPNDANKKKKEKKKKSDKKLKEKIDKSKKRKRNERTPPPSKEVFASGDNILVSVSFNKENETRDVSTRRKKDITNTNNTEEQQPVKKIRKEKRNRIRSKRARDLSDIKPVAIIDLERSPFKEITPSPKAVIILSDSDNAEEINTQKSVCDSSEQVASPEQCANTYATGPKTPPEPQVKFTLNAKPPQIRAISNPLHEPDDIEPENDMQEEMMDQRIDGMHIGPNTPPEPPNSPPSSPDAYDPFEPTKSRSPTPEPIQTVQSKNNLDDNHDDDNSVIMENRSNVNDLIEKANSTINQTPDILNSHTPPIADIQPADSQSSIHATPESNVGKSPTERIGVVINQIVQPQLTTPLIKPIAQTTPFSSVPTSLISSTPVSSNLTSNRLNILNTTIITPAIPQRIVLPNVIKSSPVKISPTKLSVKSTPIKPMPSKNVINKTRKSNTTTNNNRNQNCNESNDNIIFDSPYSPGSSDYEDLFEPPVEASTIKAPIKSVNKSIGKSPKMQSDMYLLNTFDSLFGSSPNYNKTKSKSEKTNNNSKFNKKPSNTTPTNKCKGNKQVGIKLDEDNLKILDELPNSAVEMQIKDKFLKKLNRQERVVEEVKLVLKPHYNKKHVNKEEYKDILRRAVPKICHNKSGEINPTKIKHLIEAYVKKIRHSKKVTSSSSVNLQKS